MDNNKNPFGHKQAIHFGRGSLVKIFLPITFFCRNQLPSVELNLEKYFIFAGIYP